MFVVKSVLTRNSSVPRENWIKSSETVFRLVLSEKKWFPTKTTHQLSINDVKMLLLPGNIWKTYKARRSRYIRLRWCFLKQLEKRFRFCLNSWGLFLERPGKLSGPKSYFEIKFSRRVGCVLTSNEVHFVSLVDNFTVQFSNLLKLLSRMKNKPA